MTTTRALVLLGIAISMVTACAVPSIHGIADQAPTSFDASLLGTWLDSDGARLEVARAEEGRYAITLYSEDQEPLELAAALVLVSEERILDVSLSPAAADVLDERYGALLVATHQLYRLETGENTARLEALDPEWLEGSSGYDTAVGEFGLLVSDPAHLLWLVQKALADESAWTEAMELLRSSE